MHPQGVVAACYGGVGGALGGLAGGLMLDRLGGQHMFVASAALVALGWAVATAVASGGSGGSGSAGGGGKNGVAVGEGEGDKGLREPLLTGQAD